MKNIVNVTLVKKKEKKVQYTKKIWITSQVQASIQPLKNKIWVGPIPF